MKILKPGKVDMKKFTCPRCGCVFVAVNADINHNNRVTCPQIECSLDIPIHFGESCEDATKGSHVQTNGWIDIHDQNPEIGTEIIGLYAYGSIARFLVESHGSYRKDFTEEYCKVDYWMPMPELPEEYR